MASNRSDISFEIFHPYMNEKLDEQELDSRIHNASLWATPMLECWRQQELTVSTCVLIDNISGTTRSDDKDTSELREKIAAKFSSHGIAIDYFCNEADLNDSAAWLGTHITIVPKKGDGSYGNKTIESLEKDHQRYLVAGELNEQESELARFVDDKQRGTRAYDVRRSIGISTPIYRRNSNKERDSEHDIVYSCPTLASWWQILRLGGLLDDEISDFVLQDLPHDQKSGNGTFDGLVASADECNPFCAYQTVSLLEPKYIAVEHAVRSILSLTEFSEGFLRSLYRSGQVENFSLIDERIGYGFLIPLLTSNKKTVN